MQIRSRRNDQNENNCFEMGSAPTVQCMHGECLNDVNTKFTYKLIAGMFPNKWKMPHTFPIEFYIFYFPLSFDTVPIFRFNSLILDVRLLFYFRIESLTLNWHTTEIATRVCERIGRVCWTNSLLHTLTLAHHSWILRVLSLH